MKKLILTLALLLLPVFAFAQEVSSEVTQEIWWGFNIRMKHWNSLSVEKKTQFLDEVIEQIEVNTDSNVDLIGLNNFPESVDVGVAYYLNKYPDSEIPMIRFVYDLLKEINAIQAIHGGSPEAFPDIG
jgi:hypothetical protein